MLCREKMGGGGVRGEVGWIRVTNLEQNMCGSCF